MTILGPRPHERNALFAQVAATIGGLDLVRQAMRQGMFTDLKDWVASVNQLYPHSYSRRSDYCVCR